MGLSCCSAEGVPGAASRGRASSGNRAPQAPAVASWRPGGIWTPRRHWGTSQKASMDGPVSTPTPAGRSSLRPSELRPWKGCREFQRRAEGEKFPLAQSWPGACPECPLSPWVPFFPPFIQVSHLPFQGHSLLREALPGTPSSPLPWGWHLGPFAPRRQGPPHSVGSSCPPSMPSTPGPASVSPHCGPPAAVGVDLEPPLLGSGPTSAACSPARGVPQDKSLPFSVLPSVTCEMEFGAPAPEGCVGT